jgi:hypothetical protein
VDATNADEWLAEEIFRAACDPGALAVFRCASQLAYSYTVRGPVGREQCLLQLFPPGMV